MDGARLETVSRHLASGPSRRTLLAGLSLVLPGRTLTAPAPVAGEGAGWVEVEGLGLCRLPRFPCGSDSQCCAGSCQADGTCGCRKKGRTAFLKAVCCSGKKKPGHKGKCR